MLPVRGGEFWVLITSPVFFLACEILESFKRQTLDISNYVETNTVTDKTRFENIKCNFVQIKKILRHFESL